MSLASTTTLILLTELHPRFECSMDTKEYGTFVLQGRGKHDEVDYDYSSLVDVSSLSILLSSSSVKAKANQEINRNWKRKKILKSINELHINGRKINIPTLWETLMEAAVSTKSKPEQPEWEIFYQQATAVFLALLDAMKKEKLGSDAVDETIRHSCGGDREQLSPQDLMELHRQLEDIEADSQRPNTISLSQDLSTLTLIRVDKENRNLELVIDLTEFPANAAVRSSPIPVSLQNQGHLGKESIEGNKRRRTEMITIPFLYKEFCTQVQCCQTLWNELEDLDRNVWILEASFSKEDRNKCQRSIYLDEGAKLDITLNPLRPTEKPFKMDFIGSHCHTFKKIYEKSTAWSKDRSVRENLEMCFGKSLAKPDYKPQSLVKNPSSRCLDCAICFSSTVESVDTLPSSVVNCENEQCSRWYHAHCLEKWLSTLSTTRTSFDTLLGSCPYCKTPIETLKATLRVTPKVDFTCFTCRGFLYCGI
mmetsp:Transcript_5394/g.8285  ORF Transcript_5394/g.8285 Transcript_5394/m.8285 type:complete len:479 (-) Transcript_5394:2027-3463(-)